METGEIRYSPQSAKTNKLRNRIRRTRTKVTWLPPSRGKGDRNAAVKFIVRNNWRGDCSDHRHWLRGLSSGEDAKHVSITKSGVRSRQCNRQGLQTTPSENEFIDPANE